MKRVVSVSLGSSKRNHAVEIEILGEKFSIERIGTDGDMKKAIELIQQLDGKVDAFGLGGTDLYIYAGNRRYTFRESAQIARAAQKSPIVDGSGLKNTLERRTIEYLQKEHGMNFGEKKVLIVSAVDRFGMAEALAATGCEMVMGDLIFSLGVPIPIKSLKTLDRIARVLAPIICQLPFKYLYPTGSAQESITPKHTKYYLEADVIAGDFHFIRKHMPEKLDGKAIITNTVTTHDVETLKSRGVTTLITTTPELNGRSFGTNVMEGVLVVLAGKRPEEIAAEEYNHLLDQVGFYPRVEQLNYAKTS